MEEGMSGLAGKMRIVSDRLGDVVAIMAGCEAAGQHVSATAFSTK
jgi:hypothetical protein